MSQFKLHNSRQKEEFNIAYVHSVAAAAGFGIEKPTIDISSIDLCIEQYGDSKSEKYPFYNVLYAQLKCTSRKKLIKKDHIAYPLKIKNYNDLRQKTSNPRILIVMHVPEDTNEWLKHSEKDIMLHYCAYWLSLKDEPEVSITGKKDQTVTVHIPFKNQLTVEELQRIMNLLAEGEKP